MTEDVLERLRRANPVPSDVEPPPIEVVLERVASVGLGGPPRPRRRWRAGLVPALGALTAVVVLAVALVFAGHRAPRPHSAANGSASGLPGVIFAGGSFAGDGRGVISLDQCWPCRAAAHGGRQVERTWTLTSTDGGRSWHTRRTGFGLGVAPFDSSTVQFGFSGDIWASGSYRIRQGPFRFDPYVSHDDGRTWTRATMPVPGFLGSLSTAGNSVWATEGGTCIGSYCVGARVLRGPAAGGALRPVAASGAPAHSLMRIVAADAQTAYVLIFAGREAARLVVTRDGGHTWRQLPTACRTSAPDLVLRVGDPQSVWQLCPLAGPTTVLARSNDGGRHWHRYRIPAHGGIRDLVPVSGGAAWAVSDSGYVTRTTDGGASWHTVWSAGAYRPRAHLPSLSAASATSAAITATQTAGGHTRVVVYWTHEGGHHWRAAYVPLP